MSKQEKLSIIISILKKISLIEDEQHYNDFLQSISNIQSVKILSFVNAHALNMSFKNKLFGESILDSDIILRDGIGMKILYKKLGKNPGINMNGTDLIPKILDQNKGKRIAIFGTSEPYLSKSVETLRNNGHQIIAAENGFHEKEYYVSKAKQIKPEIIILAMGMPKQELISLELKSDSENNCLIINGGAIIDFIGGKVKRAPLWMQKYGLEWFFRLVNEPKRLFERYVVGNVIFLSKISIIKKHFQ